MLAKRHEVLRKMRPDLLNCIYISELFLSVFVSNSVITWTLKEEIDVSCLSVSQ